MPLTHSTVLWLFLHDFFSSFCVNFSSSSSSPLKNKSADYDSLSRSMMMMRRISKEEKKHLSEIFIFINYQVFFYCCEIINFNIYLLLTCFFPLAGCCVYVCKFECVLIYTTLYVYFDAIKNIDFNDGVFVAHTVAI